MIKRHGLGILLAAVIVMVGFVLNPFSTVAEEFHWGFKKATDGVPPDAALHSIQCSTNMARFTKASLMKKLPI